MTKLFLDGVILEAKQSWLHIMPEFCAGRQAGRVLICATLPDSNSVP